MARKQEMNGSMRHFYLKFRPVILPILGIEERYGGCRKCFKPLTVTFCSIESGRRRTIVIEVLPIARSRRAQPIAGKRSGTQHNY